VPKGSTLLDALARSGSTQIKKGETSGRLLKHARYYWLLLAESHLSMSTCTSLIGSLVRL